MKKKLSLLIVAFMAIAAYAGLNAWRAAGETVTDELTQELTGITGSTYADFSGKTAESSAVYAGQCAGSNNSIQLRSKNNNSGIVTTVSGGKLQKIIVEWNSETAEGRTLDIYGSNTAYTAATDLYDSSKSGTKLGSIVKGTSTELIVDGDYTFVGLRSNNAAMYLDKISIVWESTSGSGDDSQTVDTKTIYLMPGVWNADGARFAVYMFNSDEDNAWADFAPVEGDEGVYNVEVSTNYASIILARMDGSTTENNWNNKWNQTENIDIANLAENTLFKITGWGDDKSPYEIATYPESTQPEEPEYYAVGVDALWGWQKAEANKLLKGDDGKYSITKNKVALAPGEYGYKIMENDAYVPDGNENEKKLIIKRTAYYNVTLTLDPTVQPLKDGYEAVADFAEQINTIPEAQAAEAGTTVAVEGVIYASAKNGAVLYDNQDYLYYYNTNNALTVGQKVLMEGQISTYGGANQLSADATIIDEGTVDGVVYPDPVELTGADFDAIMTAGVAERKYVTFTGKLSVSGNYYNVTVPGAEQAIGSLVKPSDEVYKKQKHGICLQIFRLNAKSVTRMPVL